MKKELQYIIWAHLVLFIFLIYETFDLMTLLYDDTAKDSFTPQELNNSTMLNQDSKISTVDSIIDDGLDENFLIPKIIHQTYKTTEIPEEWVAGQQRCIDLHPDYQYILWTDEMSREFIADKYPWFLETFDSYPYPIERADAIRYFILNSYGGVYIDLDDGCNKRLDPLLKSSAFLRKTIPTGISNDVMGSVPHHPFFEKVIGDLSKYNHNWFVPYITIMYSTGPLFLSVMWKQFKRWGVPLEDRIKILMPDDYKGNPDSFFIISKGSSWHTEDAKFMFQMLHHLPLAIIGGFLIGFTVLVLEFLIYKMVCLVRFNNLFNLLRRLPFANNDAFSDSKDNGIDEIIHLHQNRVEFIKRNRKDSNLPVQIDWEKNQAINTEMV